MLGVETLHHASEFRSIIPFVGAALRSGQHGRIAAQQRIGESGAGSRVGHLPPCGPGGRFQRVGQGQTGSIYQQEFHNDRPIETPCTRKAKVVSRSRGIMASAQ